MENKLIKKEGVFDLHIATELESKIRYMCNKFPNNEWSGVLFYNYTGSFKDNDLSFTAVDFFLMDYGSATYTEFEMSPDVCSYMAENPELLDCQMGLIHSHDQMKTFFSATDTSTLLSEGSERGSFLSLIVNNEGTYSAAITRAINHILQIKDNSSITDFTDIIDSDEYSEYKTSYKEVEYYMLNILKPETSFVDLDTRINEISKTKTTKNTVKSTTIYPVTTHSTYSGSLFHDSDYANDDYYRFNWDYKPYTQSKTITPSTTESYKDYAPLTDKYLEAYEVNTVKFNKMLKQIIMGSISVLPKDDIDVLIPKMSSYLSKVFPDIKVYTDFIENFIVSLFNTIDDENLKNEDKDIPEAVYAYKMINILDEYPSNKYINAIMECLELYINY